MPTKPFSRSFFRFIRARPIPIGPFAVWWVAWALIAFIALPAILMLLLPGKRLRDCNLSWQGFREHYSVYVVLYAAVLPVVWLVSLSPDFYNFYPMYPQAGRSWFDLFAWEGLYAGQFVALEFFFRGFLVGGLSRYMGIAAVPVSVMPYMMIHFTKPWPEALASIVAGLVLGSLAWKTKSIWGGVCVHTSRGRATCPCSDPSVALPYPRQVLLRSREAQLSRPVAPHRCS